MNANKIQEVFRNDDEIIGAHIVLCTNIEIVGQRHDIGLDDDDAERIIAVMAAALDNDGWRGARSNSSSFKDWRGGRYARDGDTLAVLWYTAEADDDGEPGRWRSIWRWGAGSAEIPAEAIAIIDSVGDRVFAAAERTAELIKVVSRVKSRR